MSFPDYDDGTYNYTFYVVDNSGNAKDWTGYITFWDLDYGDKCGEIILVKESCIKEYTYTGKYVEKLAGDRDVTDYKKFRATKEYIADNQSPRDDGDSGVVLKVHIPTSGMPLQLRARAFGGVSMEMLTEIMNRCSLTGSSTWANI